MFTRIDDKTPATNVLLLAKCEGWNNFGYQVCKFDGESFYFSGQPNDMFHEYVTHWALIDNLKGN